MRSVPTSGIDAAWHMSRFEGFGAMLSSLIAIASAKLPMRILLARP